MEVLDGGNRCQRDMDKMILCSKDSCASKYVIPSCAFDTDARGFVDATPLVNATNSVKIMDSNEALVQGSSKELVFHKNSVTDFEKQSLPEFFEGRVNRTRFCPEQYVQIRNLFLHEWERKKPQHVKFREIIQTHRGIGNVVSFSKVCKFLTSIGAINCPNSTKIVFYEDNIASVSAKCSPSSSHTEGFSQALIKDQLESTKECDDVKPKKARKRRSYYLNEMGRLGIDPVASGFTIPESEIKNVYGDCKKGKFANKPDDTRSSVLPGAVDAVIVQQVLENCVNIVAREGYTKDIGPCQTAVNSKSNGIFKNGPVQKVSLKAAFTKVTASASSNTTCVKKAALSDEADVTGSKTLRARPNPFKLVQCKKYGSEKEAPFRLIISVEALTVIDVHAHCLETEVIGLLGGRFCPLRNELHIFTAEPCESLSASTSDLQCEMDPVSQASVSEKLSKAGYNVVGWYHSHPTFVPNPSLRDLETQAKYQELFAEGNQPFIAVILSPYSVAINTNHRNTFISKYKCLMVSSEQNVQNDYRIPYEFLPVLVRREKLAFNVVTRLKELSGKLVADPSLIPLTEKIKGKDVQYVQKLSVSLTHYLELAGLSSTEIGYLLMQIKQILVNLMHKSSR